MADPREQIVNALLAQQQPALTVLPPSQEAAFRSWYGALAPRLGIGRNPDDPQHFYDYRGAYAAGMGPGPDGHWPSQFKIEGHPRMVLDGVNTKTGERVR